MANATPSTATPSTATPSTLTMKAVKSHADMSDFYGLSLTDVYQSAYVKGAAHEAYARMLAGSAVEIAHSGNANGLAFLRSTIDSLKVAKKHACASVHSTMLAMLENVKAAHLKSADIATYVDFAESMSAALIAVMVTPKAAKPKATPTDWKARALAAESMVTALGIDIAALKAALKATETAPTETATA